MSTSEKLPEVLNFRGNGFHVAMDCSTAGHYAADVLVAIAVSISAILDCSCAAVDFWSLPLADA